jgi:TPR repeat protein
MMFFRRKDLSSSDSQPLTSEERKSQGKLAIEKGDLHTALAIFKELAERGDAESQCRVGFLHKVGTGDLKLAAYWYRMAAEQGHAEAQCKLGLLYRAGTGVEKNDCEAARLYHNSAVQGYDEGQYNWGVMNLQGGGGVQKDPSEAVRWFKRAAEQGHGPAQLNLGICYATGLGVPRDQKAGLIWLRKAALLGLPEAQHALEMMGKSE